MKLMMILKLCRWIWSVFMKLNSIEEVGNIVDTSDNERNMPIWMTQMHQTTWMKFDGVDVFIGEI
jgi:hypothetical protein